MLLALFILNALITLFHWGSYEKPLLMFQPSVECLVLALIVLALTFPRKRPGGLLILGAAVGLLLLWGIGETFTRFFYERYFVPWTDLKYIPNLVAMTMGNTPGRVLLGAGIILGVVVAAIGGSWVLLRWLSDSIRKAGPFALGALWLVPLGLAIGFPPSLAGVVAAHLLPPPPEVFESAAQSIAAASREPARFPLLQGRNVYLFIVESYGSTLFLNPAHERMAHAFFADLADRIQKAGYTTYSQFLDSPTTGGRSWLADTTLLTGVRVTTEDLYARLRDQGTRASLPYLFEQAGYHTTLAAPANVSIVDKDAAFFHFDTYFSHNSFGYRGPMFPWGFMPDQYFMNTIRKRILGKGGPQFIEFVTVSSHAPFNLVPQFIEDWDSIRDGSEYYTTDNPRFDNHWLTGRQYVEGYVVSEEYALAVIADYLAKYIPDDSLVVIVGDHQPRYPIREDGESSAVPMHILSRDPRMVEAFSRYGFTPGLVPKAGKVPGMERFFPIFVSALEEKPQAGG